jgi:hypothetical protein
LPTPIPSALAASVNANLRSLIPNGDVAYERKQVIGDLHEAIARAESEYLGKLAPSPEILRKALYVVNRRRTTAEPDSVMYVLKKLNIFGFKICTGWLVVAHPMNGGAPESGYAFGACNSSQFEAPPWATATLPPHETPSPLPAALPSPSPRLP